jgi:hypothetical protein
LLLLEKGKGQGRLSEKREGEKTHNSASQFTHKSQELEIQDKKHFKGFYKKETQKCKFRRINLAKQNKVGRNREEK